MTVGPATAIHIFDEPHLEQSPVYRRLSPLFLRQPYWFGLVSLLTADELAYQF